MKRITRRKFLAATSAAGTAALLGPTAKVLGANNDIRVAVIGFRSKGSQHIKVVRGMKGVRLVALCDADRKVLDRGVADCKKHGVSVDGYQDMRKLFDRKDIDAIITATPNHWHVLTAIWAMQSGKDVYVEKPVCHDVWEGRKIVEAARKYNRICQGGFQNRSDDGLRPFYAWLKEGHIGKVKMVRGLCYRNRSGIGKLSKPLVPPASVNYDLWLGPAADLPIYRPRLHYDWHWVWNTGNGDIGNQGPHELDLINWALGNKTIPRSVMSFGGRFGWHDAGETPNMQVAVFDCDGVPVIFEVRDLTVAPKKNYSPHYKGIRVGVIITCEGGVFRGGRGGGHVYDNNGKKIKSFP
ncbi:MAG: Gfo/Idh/MocA family oxidoreductase, partial [Planctomycetes bacterium]|nr:Gfo/Idh/MocA family oxidoreductase [Planctomycetota bacterium]